MLVLNFVPQTFLKNGASKKSGMLTNKSIAVLYFENMSGDPEQEYFSDGITEEIISRLAQIEGLRVISRTSTRVYKGKPLNLKKIAAELNVSAVLEGSFRKSGNQIKVTAQLIDAETDEHIWAETFDIELKDIFQVQSDIAYEIAKKFEVEIASEINLKINERITSNAEAYDYYLRARHIADKDYDFQYDSIDFVRSKTMYEKSILIDSTFAEAYAGLASLYSSYQLSNIKSFSEEMDSIMRALSWKAYRLDSNSAFVNNVRVWMLIIRDEPLVDSAFYHAKKAFELDPNDDFNYQTVGYLLTMTGLHNLAIPFYKKSIGLNPLDPHSHAALGLCYWTTGDIENAEKYFNQAFELEQHKNYGYSWATAYWYLNEGDVNKAISLIENLNIKWIIKTFLKVEEGNLKEAEIIADSTKWLWFKAELYNKLNQKIKAIEAISEDPEAWTINYLWLSNVAHWKSYHSEPKFLIKFNAIKQIYEQNLLKYGLTLSDFSIRE